MPGGKVGDIWQGITDMAVREEYTRMDRIREKCRACPYLPDCTSYACCPVEAIHCREVRALLKQELLEYMVDRRAALSEECIKTEQV